MKSIPKEYNVVVACGFTALLMLGGFGYFAFDSLSLESEGLEALAAVSEKIEKFNKSTTPPTDSYLKELIEQKNELSSKIEGLQAIARATDIPTEDLSPEDFQKNLNQKAQSIAEKASKESIQIPADFYLDFNQYLQKLPSKELTPFMGRQLAAVGLLIDILLDSSPLELRSFERKSPDKAPDYALPETASENQSNSPQQSPAAAQPKGKAGKSEPQPQLKASLSAQTFEIVFTTRPERLRTFLNGVCSEQKAFFIVRNLKVSNSKQRGPSKNLEPQPGDTVGGSTETTTADPLGSAPTEPTSPYIVGEEHIEVRASIDLVALAPGPAPASVSANEREPSQPQKP